MQIYAVSILLMQANFELISTFVISDCYVNFMLSGANRLALCNYLN
jgi:hypothetical protein